MVEAVTNGHFNSLNCILKTFLHRPVEQPVYKDSLRVLFENVFEYFKLYIHALSLLCSN